MIGKRKLDTSFKKTRIEVLVDLMLRMKVVAQLAKMLHIGVGGL